MLGSLALGEIIFGRIFCRGYASNMNEGACVGPI